MARATDPPTEQETPDEGITTQEGEQYTTRGQTRLATRHGYRFRPSDTNLPEVTSAGINVTKDQADLVLAESEKVGGHVYLVEIEKEA